MAATIFMGSTVRIRKNKIKETTEFWQYFSSNNIFAKIENLLAPRVVAMYSRYNTTGVDCDFWLGGLVSEGNKKNELLKFKKIPEQLYAVFEDVGIPTEITPRIWEEIIRISLDRSFESDFEIYTPRGDGNFRIQIYVSLN